MGNNLLQETIWNANSSALGQGRSQWRASASTLAGRPTWELLWWKCAIACLLRKKWVMPSAKKQKFRSYSLWSSRGALTPLRSSGRTLQEDSSNLGHFLSALQPPRTHTGGAKKERCSAKSDTSRRWKNCLETWKLEAALAAVTIKWWRADPKRRQESKNQDQPWITQKAISIFSGVCLEERHGIKSCGEEDSSRAGWYKRIISLSSRKGCPEKYEIKQDNLPRGLHGYAVSILLLTEAESWKVCEQQQ